MDDLISRQAAIDTAKRLHDVALANWKETKISANTMIDALKDLPSAQPEIIHCCDCKHYYYADNRIPQEQRYSCDLDGDRWTPDSYCSFAERRQ